MTCTRCDRILRLHALPEYGEYNYISFRYALKDTLHCKTSSFHHEHPCTTCTMRSFHACRAIITHARQSHPEEMTLTLLTLDQT